MIVITDGAEPGIPALDKEGLLLGVLSSNFICREGDFYQSHLMWQLKVFLIEHNFLTSEWKHYGDYSEKLFKVIAPFSITFGEQGSHLYEVGAYANTNLQDIILYGGALYK